jgi:Tfp pilus assembly protein PilN
MREIDFLPDWYRRVLRQRKRLATQACCALMLFGAIGLRAAYSHHHAAVAAAATAQLERQITQAKAQAQEIDRLASLRLRWAKQEQRIERLGSHVEAARLLSALDEAMPSGVSLSDLQVDTDERPSTAPSDATAAIPAERRLRVRLEGVASTPAELDKFVARLKAVPHFDQVSVGFNKNTLQAGRSVDQFEISFSINLNQPM